MGICGAKVITILTPGDYEFLSIEAVADPLSDNFDLVYTKSAATEADIGMHEVGYSVAF